MRIRDHRSIIIVFIYIVLNVWIFTVSFRPPAAYTPALIKPKAIAPAYSMIENLDYFHLKKGIPQMSLAADSMRSQGQESAEFKNPKGVYNHQQKNQTMRYQALKAFYQKERDLLNLNGEVKISSPEAQYFAKNLDYFFKKDLILGTGGVKFLGSDPKSKDSILIEASNLRAHPSIQWGKFSGNVKGVMERQQKYEGRMTFSSRELQLDAQKSLAHLEGDVNLRRQSYFITAGKGDIHLENYNKSLKYFVLNDDVKVTETLTTPRGLTQRKSYSERLEGFGREQKMVLSGAPRVEQGSDVIKGYRITIRENADLIEVDDAMTDVQVKRQDKDKLKE